MLFVLTLIQSILENVKKILRHDLTSLLGFRVDCYLYCIFIVSRGLYCQIFCLENQLNQIITHCDDKTYCSKFSTELIKSSLNSSHFKLSRRCPNPRQLSMSHNVICFRKLIFVPTKSNKHFTRKSFIALRIVTILSTVPKSHLNV